MFRYHLNTPQNPYLNFTIETGKYQGIELQSAVISPCMEPTCNCSHIYFSKQSEHQTNEYFALDVDQRKVLVYRNNKPNQNDFTEALSSEISENDWNDIYKFYFNLKISLCEMVEPEKINFPFEKEEIKQINDGIVYPFHTVFPWGMKFIVEEAESSFLMFDYYCLRPSCGCKEVIFYLENTENQNEYFNLSFNYETKQWEIDQVSESLPSEKVEKILENIKTNLQEQILLYVPNRHARMRRIFELSKLKQHQTETSVAENKIGRNDPCPCGSGKKYKNCHGQ